MRDHLAFPIRNDDDHARAIELVDALWSATPGSPEHDLLEVMAALIHLYESERRDLPPPDPRALIAFKLRELSWSQRELGRRLGWSSGRVSEVLSGRRPLTLRMVQDLGRVLGLRAGALVWDPQPEAEHPDRHADPSEPAEDRRPEPPVTRAGPANNAIHLAVHSTAARQTNTRFGTGGRA
jgi:HTH-type transcriptional regulator/antitoxin HigA